MGIFFLAMLGFWFWQHGWFLACAAVMFAMLLEVIGRVVISILHWRKFGA